VAHTEEEAAERLRGKAFHVVLIDLKLPGGDDGAVFRLVRRTSPQTRTILITGYRSEMDQLVQQVTAEGADAVCYKPFDVPRMLELLQRLSKRANGKPT
jgi:CheY-like chemotaxis protein